MNTIFMVNDVGTRVALIGNEVDGNPLFLPVYSLEVGEFVVRATDTWGWILAPNDEKTKELENELRKLGYMDNLQYLLYGSEVSNGFFPLPGLVGDSHVIASTIPVVENNFTKTLEQFGGRILSRIYLNYKVEQLKNLAFVSKYFKENQYLNIDHLAHVPMQIFLLEIWKKQA
jgi:hypothetical protein